MNANKADKGGNDPARPRATAVRLRREGFTNEAMAYFWRAGEMYAEAEQWEEAGDCLAEAGSCYGYDHRWKEAASDYARAAEFYRRAGLTEKAAEITRRARSLAVKGGASLEE